MNHSEFNKYNPKNLEHAYCFQLEDDVKLLNSLALIHQGNTDEFEEQLQNIEGRIQSYRKMKIAEQQKKK